jgi:hypothetical protein
MKYSPSLARGFAATLQKIKDTKNGSVNSDPVIYTLIGGNPDDI